MDTDFQDSLDEVREEYERRISEKKEDLLSIITHYCQESIDFEGGTIETDFRESVEKLLRFDALDCKLRQLDSIWFRHSRYFATSAHQKGKKINPPLKEGRKHIEGLKKEVHYLQNFIHGKLKNIMTAIENCSRGRKRSVDFQKAVCNLFEWLFIDKLKRRDKLKRTPDGSQIKDGVFEIEEGCTPEKDFGCQFQYLYLECKNYKKQKVKSKDLFQLFGYTLFAANTGIFQNIPICLLISRRNPDTNDLVWGQRWRIYDKFEKRLILFLDDKDLSKMVKNKLESDNPGEVIKGKIKGIREDIAKHAGRYI